MVRWSYRCPQCQHEDKWKKLEEHMAECCPLQPFTQQQLRIYDPHVVAKQEQKKAARAKFDAVAKAKAWAAQAKAARDSRTPCRYHFAGPGYKCHHGDRCRFSHAAEDDPRNINSNSGWASHNPSFNGTSGYLMPVPPPPPSSSWVAGPSPPPRHEEQPDSNRTDILPPGGYGELLLARMKNQQGTGTGPPPP